MRLEKVVPWGRLASEYERMFSLTSQDKAGRIVDCGGGPSSFTAERTAQGGRVLSCDPLYQFSQQEIRERIEETYARMTAMNEETKERFIWDYYGSPAQLSEIRMQAMRLFLEDYPAGRAQGRYIIGELPHLPLPSAQFDLALCSHFLFTYSEHFTTEFHLQSLREMARVAHEVRVFPVLVAFSGEVSPHLAPIRTQLQQEGFAVEVRKVDYEFQRGGNEMLVLKRCLCL